jgi:hypothetical protein
MDRKIDNKYRLTSNHALYYDGKAYILKTGTILYLAGFDLSKHTSSSPFHFHGDIVRIPNCLVEKIKTYGSDL